VQRTVAQIPWRSNIVLMDKLNDEQTRLWYAQKLPEDLKASLPTIEEIERELELSDQVEIKSDAESGDES
jgi:hypothetical protein